MDRFYGFDLGDAESAVSRIEKEGTDQPEILQVEDAGSFVTAYARTTGGELLIGERACYQADVVRRQLRFKSRFLTDPKTSADVRSFAAGVLGNLYEKGHLIRGEDSCFYIGCPAGWNGNARERYRAIFEEVGYPPVKIISESRAAMVSACQSRHLQVGYDILSKPVLVIDIGSSTTDFAYIYGGREVEILTAGEVSLGGGIMDEILLDAAVEASGQPEQIRRVFAESEPWRSYCEFAARRLKERYYREEEYWQEEPCCHTVMIQYDSPLRLTLRMDQGMARTLVEKRWDGLGGRSFRETFLMSLRDVRDHIDGELPELLFLTGGVSRLPAIRGWCEQIFPDAVVITGLQPEFAVSRGLAWSGRIDEQLRQFKKELKQLIDSNTVERIVREHISDLYRRAVDALVQPLLLQTALPVFEQWRSGEIRTLADTDGRMQEEIGIFLRSEKARELLEEPVTAWLRPVADALEEYTLPICVRHEVPYTALSLNSYLAASEIDVRIEAKNIFALEEITWLIDSVISVVVGLLCGGGGVALITGGPTGIIAGAAASLLLLALGKDKMEEALLKADLPRPVRRLVPKNAFRGRMGNITGDVKETLYQSLEKEKNEEIAGRLSDEIAAQIEQCLTKMAEVVEIPLG